MKTEKLSFKAIKNVLSRAEMRKIMAGSDRYCPNQAGCFDGGDTCDSGCTCQSISFPDGSEARVCA